MKKLLLLLITITMQISAAAAAQHACSPIASDNETGNCSPLMKSSAESELNTAYRNAKKRIEAAYRADEGLGKHYLQTLLDSQRGWLKYRDGQCRLEAFIAEEGSAANAELTDGCVIRMDKERIAQLNAMPYQ
ncbi:lysozyme inhibitor LprI family protein [Brenneria populi]|uniref:Lysozyme inhibitor LprI family protein n=1 Tax=Brenneria populi TaxID=1505588 RepID=A0ABU6JTB6_9GAMM|nr:lysozyme inhibitor LprI family protein [Brenneria populi Li et al. 2015]